MIYLTFAIAVALLIASPGPVISLIISESRATIPKSVIAGAALSAQILLCISFFAIFHAVTLDAALLQVGQVIGGIYLIYIAINSFTDPIDIRTESHHKGSFSRAMKIGLSNPKDILFFLAFLPGFISRQGNFLLHSVTLMGIWFVIDMSIMLMYSYFATRIFAHAWGRFCIARVPCVTMLIFGSIALYDGARALLL